MSAPSATKSRIGARASSKPRETRASVRASSRMPSAWHASTAARQRRPRLVAFDHQLRALVAEWARPDLVLDQHRGGAGTGIGADRLLHTDRVAVAGVAIGKPQHVRSGGNDGVHRVAHLGEGQQVHVRHGESQRGDRRTGSETGPEPRLLDEMRAHAHRRSRASPATWVRSTKPASQRPAVASRLPPSWVSCHCEFPPAGRGRPALDETEVVSSRIRGTSRHSRASWTPVFAGHAVPARDGE